jgi:hypothetical protein
MPGIRARWHAVSIPDYAGTNKIQMVFAYANASRNHLDAVPACRLISVDGAFSRPLGREYAGR